jgi:hypothetical protein
MNENEPTVSARAWAEEIFFDGDLITDNAQADGVAQNQVVFHLSEGTTHPIGGETLQISIVADGNVVYKPHEAATDSNGDVIVTLTDDTVETVTVVARTTSADISASPLMTAVDCDFTKVKPTEDVYTLTGTIVSNGAVANGVAFNQIAFIVYKNGQQWQQAGNTVTIAPYSSQITPTPLSAQTNTSGTAAFTCTSLTAGTNFSMTASLYLGNSTIAAATATLNGIVFVQPVDEYTLTATATITGKPADGVSRDAVTFTLRSKATGAAVSGQTITFGTSSNLLTLVAPSGSTNASGQTIAYVTSKNASNHLVTGTVTINNRQYFAQAIINFVQPSVCYTASLSGGAQSLSRVIGWFNFQPGKRYKMTSTNNAVSIRSCTRGFHFDASYVGCVKGEGIYGLSYDSYTDSWSSTGQGLGNGQYAWVNGGGNITICFTEV